MKLAAVVVWFNPDQNCVENIKSYISLVDKIYIIDNSSKNNQFLIEKVSNSEKIKYIANNENLGIAYALNIGCKMAVNSDFEWVMTMDQDSFWTENELKKYIFLIETKESDIVSFSPNCKISKKAAIMLQIYHKIRNKKVNDECVSKEKLCDMVITSGNILKLKVWQEVNGFNNSLFIDEVDYDFCFKIREHGYKILKINEVNMEHSLGNPRMYFFPCVSYHTGIRIYYINRNLIYMLHYHKQYAEKNGYKIIKHWRVLELLFNLRLRDLIFLIKGRLDAKKGHFGSYESLHR